LTETKAVADRVLELARGVREASFAAARAPSAQRDRALRQMATSLRDQRKALLEANQQDLAAAEANGMAAAMRDRLRLTPERIAGMASALEDIALLHDPLGRVDEMWTRPNGLRVGRKRIPLGVVGFIYEARPNVTSDAAGLCLKSGNGVLLKGGREAFHSNLAVVAALHQGLEAADLPPAVASFIDLTDRDAVRAMLSLEDWIDVIIPRGGEGLIRFVSAHARMPVIKHYKGVCHIFIDASAEVNQAVDIVVNAKCQRPSVCNAVETLLVHRDAVADTLPTVANALIEHGVTLHACERSLHVLGEHPNIIVANDDDWSTEYLSLDLAVRVVDSLDDAVDHIRRFGSEHTEAILTHDYAAAETFLNAVDSSTVLVNASTRVADGGQLGLGAEIGISTTKLHAFGPMGLRELTTTKFVVYGHGQTRQ